MKRQALIGAAVLGFCVPLALAANRTIYVSGLQGFTARFSEETLIRLSCEQESELLHLPLIKTLSKIKHQAESGASSSHSGFQSWAFAKLFPFDARWNSSKSCCATGRLAPLTADTIHPFIAKF